MTCTVFLRGRLYHYRFRLAPLPRVQRSTRERDKRRAQAIANLAYAAALIRVNGGHIMPTLDALIAEWEEIRGPVASASHRRGISTFKRNHLYGMGPLPIDQLNTLRVEVARNKHLATRKPASGNHWLRILRLLVNWAVKRNVLPSLPWDIAMLPEQKTPRKILPLALTDAWFSALDTATGRNSSVGIAVRLMYGLGLRESEAASARWEWVDWERGTYTPGITKGKEAVPIRMPGWLAEYLQARRKVEGLVAPSRRRGQLPEGYARHAMRKANAITGLTGITPHRLRGTCATLLSEEGTPIQTIQAMMRHKDSATTMRYLEINMDTAGAAQDRIESKIRFGGRESGADLPGEPVAT
ncbi:MULTISPECIES: site-specific integrase [unclassified Janthinobacterium]|uniref:tyrosine-type recombinase/integrase n=1 Tax=unclassified Janthinobacterium TaxID=2610881 RepID=UPI00160E01E5|nr:MULTISPECIES: site-specific integrase [unclassified Janthinobacterium]MBB5610557.1 integrase [Janthinobacterium sp. S3T4]MBB5615989.1 integrase [Janthinobacterium sp. S3M3]